MSLQKLLNFIQRHYIIILIITLVPNVLAITLALNSSVLQEKQETVKAEATAEILPSPWHFEGNKIFSEQKQSIDPALLVDKTALSLVYNLHGLCLLQGPASSIYFADAGGNKYAVSLAKYGKNCYDGEQSVIIPLEQFIGPEKASNVTEFGASFWYPTTYMVDINKATVFSNVLGTTTRRRRSTKSITPTPTTALIQPISITVTQSATPTPTILGALTATPTPTPTTVATHPTWSIQSVSSMKVSKDRVCDQPTLSYLQQWVDTAKNLGVNYIAVETPYDNPSCGNSVAYTKTWVDVIRSRGLKVWHRHMPLAFEGIYNVPKNNTTDFLQQISDYIKAHSTFFQEGDIFTPIPEPQNGGIYGVTYCPYGICEFADAANFNLWLRNAMLTAELAFETVGLKDKIKIGYFGFDGFVTWGDNNPDWHGILEDATIAKMGNITIDHYPEAVGDTMQNDLNELQAKYPNTPVIIGEWGTITGGNIEQQVLDSMGAAVRPNVVGFNYWHLGPGGNEALINDDFSHRAQFDEVQSFYKSTR